MKLHELFRELERGKILPLYYFCGPEKWMIQEAIGKIKEKTLDPRTRDLNWGIFDAKENSPETILDSLQIFPVRSPRRLVLIQNGDTIRDPDASSYVEYFLNPNPMSCAIFIGEKADLRVKFFQALGKKGAIISFYPPNEKELIRWIHSQAQALHYAISDAAVSLLMERVGPNLQELNLELQKLILGLDNRKRIDEEDILALTENIRGGNPFELPRAVGHLNLQEILYLLRKNLQRGDPPLLLLSLIIRQLRMIRKAQELKARGSTKREMETKFKIVPQRAEDFWKQVERFSFSSLEKLWQITLEVDRELKSSRVDKGLLLERYLWDIYLLQAVSSPLRPTRKN